MSESIDEAVEAERLRQVRALIEDVLREHDVCGQVILAGRAGRFENFTHLTASWSKVRIEQYGGVEAVRIRSRLVDYGGDQQHQRRDLEWSAGVVSGFAEIGAMVAVDWIAAAELVDKATKAEHSQLKRDDPRDPK